MREGIPAGPDINRDAFKYWNESSQEKALELLRSYQQSPWKPFYCTKPMCDGLPHDDWDWKHARFNQHPPSFAGDWLVWLIRGGRGGGKTRSGSELVHKMVEKLPRIGLVAPTGPDLRDTMIEGISGLLATAAPGKRPEWEPSKKRLTWPNGAIAQGFSGEEPDRLRGPQFYFTWIDEPAHMPLIEDVWSNLHFGLRLGKEIGWSPRVCATTTPTPTKWMKELIADEFTVESRFSTYDNIENLADSFRRVVIGRYEGTRLGKQELYGEVLEDVEGALWKWEMIQYVAEPPPFFDRIVVSVDPAGTKNKRSDETGIVVLGIYEDVIYVLSDRSGKYSPNGWASACWNAYNEFAADCIVAETNYGGDMVVNTLENSGFKDARIRKVHSRRGKQLRAEPIVALYEKKRVIHVKGALDKLENEMTMWVPGKGDSPNRVDALVHGATELGKIRMPMQVASPVDLNRHLRAVS